MSIRSLALAFLVFVAFLAKPCAQGLVPTVLPKPAEEECEKFGAQKNQTKPCCPLIGPITGPHGPTIGSSGQCGVQPRPSPEEEKGKASLTGPRGLRAGKRAFEASTSKTFRWPRLNFPWPWKWPWFQWPSFQFFCVSGIPEAEPTQFGRPNPFQGVPAGPLTFSPGPNGWWDHPNVNFRIRLDDVEPTLEWMEIYHVDGSVTRLLRHTDGEYRQQWHRDPYDNETLFEWEEFGTVWRLKKTTYASGIEEIFSYQAGPGSSTDVIVTYTGVIAPNLSQGAPELSWGYRVSAVGDLMLVWHPRRQVVTATPGGTPAPGVLPTETPSDTLYTVPAMGYGSEYAFVEEFKWQKLPSVGGSEYLTEVWEHHVPASGFVNGVPDLASSGVGSTRVLLNTYSQTIQNSPPGYQTSLDMFRVTSQIDRYGHQHDFYYELGPVDASWGGTFKFYVTKGTWEAPDGTKQIWHRDHHGRVTSLQVVPKDDASGLPRKYETGSPSVIAEPASVTWLYEFGSAACGCSKPTKITMLPSGRVHQYTWDSTTFNLLSETHPDPSAAPGSNATVTTSYQYKGRLGVDSADGSREREPTQGSDSA